MYSLHLHCSPEQVDQIAADLNEFETTGIREVETADQIFLIAGFSQNQARPTLLEQFRSFSPEWHEELDTDWVQYSKSQWQPRVIGSRLFLLPAWSTDESPEGRIALRHNPGLACGTGEHPCTQLALEAVEIYAGPNQHVLDVGTGSGILAVAALLLGAAPVVGTDLDEAALFFARENFFLNGTVPLLIAGSADCFADRSFDVTIANISSSVLLSLLGDLVRVTAANGWLILTGFSEDEAHFFSACFTSRTLSEMDGWACIAVKPSSYVPPSSPFWTPA